MRRSKKLPQVPELLDWEQHGSSQGLRAELRSILLVGIADMLLIEKLTWWALALSGSLSGLAVYVWMRQKGVQSYANQSAESKRAGRILLTLTWLICASLWSFFFREPILLVFRDWSMMVSFSFTLMVLAGCGKSRYRSNLGVIVRS